MTRTRKGRKEDKRWEEEEGVMVQPPRGEGTSERETRQRKAGWVPTHPSRVLTRGTGASQLSGWLFQFFGH